MAMPDVSSKQSEASGIVTFTLNEGDSTGAMAPRCKAGVMVPASLTQMTIIQQRA